MNIFKVEFKKISKGLIIWTISLVAILAMYLMFFPSMKDAGFSELTSAKMNMFPDALKEAFRLETMPNFEVYIEYLSFVIQFIVIAVSVYAIVFGINSLSSEEQEKTIEFQMANPISRSKLITVKMIVGFTVVTVVMVALLVTSLIGGILYDKSEHLTEVITIITISAIAPYIYFSIGFMLSAIFKKTISTSGTALGIFFGTYIIGIMAGVIDKIKWMKYLSPLNYVVPVDVLNSNLVNKLKGDFNMIGIYIGLAVIIISVITTYIVYNKKDMEI